MNKNDFTPFKNLIGKRFDRLVIIGFDHKACNGLYHYKCKCDCGNECVKSISYLTGRRAKNKSCGCIGSKIKSNSNRKHGLCLSTEYRSWQKMLSRCTNPNSDKFIHYGGRGIKVCERWLHSFENFLGDMGEKPEPKKLYSLDRIDVNGDYCPENCRWATQKEQMNNLRKTIKYEYKGRIQSFTDWCIELGLSKGAVRSLIRRNGYTFEESVEYYKQKGIKK